MTSREGFRQEPPLYPRLHIRKWAGYWAVTLTIRVGTVRVPVVTANVSTYRMVPDQAERLWNTYVLGDG